MSQSLNNTATQNAYTTAVQVTLAVGVRINIQVNNAAAYWRWSRPGYNTQAWQPEEFLLPGKYSFDRSLGAAQFRSGATAVPAQVTATILADGDVG